jgi:hypothetical protein
VVRRHGAGVRLLYGLEIAYCGLGLPASCVGLGQFFLVGLQFLRGKAWRSVGRDGKAGEGGPF